MSSLLADRRQTKKSVTGSDEQPEHWNARDHRDKLPDHDQRGDNADENRRPARGARDSFLEAEGLRDHVRGRHREHRGREQVRTAVSRVSATPLACASVPEYTLSGDESALTQ
jgi:hypothetical protein